MRLIFGENNKCIIVSPDSSSPMDGMTRMAKSKLYLIKYCVPLCVITVVNVG